MEFDPDYRMSPEEVEEYEREIGELREKYRGKVEVVVGYEVDFTPLPHFNRSTFDRSVDYFIGSVHFLDRWGFDNPEFIREWERRRVEEVYEEYFYYLDQLVESGYFQIVGHLDLVKVFGHRPAGGVLKFVEPILKKIKRHGLVVELNSSGWRKPVGEPYPSPEIVRRMADLGIPITFGSDAHALEQVGYRLPELVELAKGVGYREAVYFKKLTPYRYPL